MFVPMCRDNPCAQLFAVGYSLGAVLLTKYTADADSGLFGHFGHRSFSQATLDPPLHTYATPHHAPPSALSTHKATAAAARSPLATPPRAASSPSVCAPPSGHGSCAAPGEPGAPRSHSARPSGHPPAPCTALLPACNRRAPARPFMHGMHACRRTGGAAAGHNAWAPGGELHVHLGGGPPAARRRRAACMRKRRRC